MTPMIVVVLCMAAAACAAPSPSWGPAGYGGHGGWAGAPANIALSADGKNVLDTPEVAHAKAAHLAALAQAQSRSGPDHGSDDGSYDSRWENDGSWQPAQQSWGPSNHGAQAWGPAPAQAQSWGPGPSHGPAAWGPGPAHGQAHIALSPDGQHILDTPEVAQAKAEHYAAHAKASAAGHGHGAGPQVWNGAPSWQAAPQWNAAPAPQWNAAPQWNQHAAAPVALTPNGHYIQDTPEVAQAKAAHLQAHAQAGGHHGAPAW